MKRRFPLHGWIGLLLIAAFWTLNWVLPGLRTQWAFFPLWLGYALTVDALVFLRTDTSLLTRSWKKYLGLFLASSPVWWLFELANRRLQNWTYVGAEAFSPFLFGVWATLNFTTVIPAVFGSAELVRSYLRKPVKGPIIRPTKSVTIGFFLAGWMMLAAMAAWPKIFFPFVWISLYFIMEPVNIWLGRRSLVEWTKDGDWRPVVTLWLGVLLTAFFWEMWNFLSYPKWVYHVPWGDWLHVFEMPLLGYGGYLPFALELFALYHFLAGLFGGKKTEYVIETSGG
ncbi:MAG: membrane protein [Anaerolineaceae bacterium]|nr:MAG: membrane protein [Anaerolineaceae bacterium]